jgi:hypothetical protein
LSTGSGYACLLILAAKTARDYAGAVATANQLDFPTVQWKLQNQAVDPDRLKDALDRDHERLIYLLKNAPNPPTGEAAIEERMLEIYYRFMHAWYGAANRFLPPRACRALGRMSIVLAHFANTMGERVAAGLTVDCWQATCEPPLPKVVPAISTPRVS